MPLRNDGVFGVFAWSRNATRRGVWLQLCSQTQGLKFSWKPQKQRDGRRCGQWTAESSLLLLTASALFIAGANCNLAMAANPTLSAKQEVRYSILNTNRDARNSTIAANSGAQESAVYTNREASNSPLSATPDLTELEKEARYSIKTPTVLAKLQSFLEREPNNSRAHFLLGIVLERNGFVELADQEYETADHLDPSGNASALNIFTRKWEYIGSDAAFRYQANFETHSPSDPSVLLMRAFVATRAGKLDVAERFYKQAMTQHSGIAGVASAYASFLIQQKRFDEAIKYADLDLALKSDHPVASLAKGEALIGKRKYLQAVPLVQKVYDSPQIDNDEKLQAARLLSRLYLEQGMFKAALEPSMIMLATTPVSNQVELARATNTMALLLKHNSEDAVVSTMQMLKQQFKNVEFTKQMVARLANLAALDGKSALAKKLFEQETLLNPQSASAYFHLARFAEHDGDYQAAENLLRIALKVAPQDKDISANLRRIQLRLINQQRDLAGKIKSALKL